jgi:excisionase family DNA binding protein
VRVEIELSEADVQRIAEAVAAKLAPSNPAVSIAEAARQLGVSTRTLNRMVATGLVQSSKVGARTLIVQSEIGRVLAGVSRARE